jgi:hypothetical protein
MSVRVRYTKDHDGTFLSKRVIPTNHGEVMVRYNTDNRIVVIFSAANPEKVLKSFTFTTDGIMKKQIKATLIELGAVFAEETRNRLDVTLETN